MVSDGLQLLTVRETAKLLSRSLSAVREDIRSGRLPIVRVGRSVRVRVRDIEAIVNQGVGHASA